MKTLPNRLVPFFLHFIRKQPVAFTLIFLAPTINIIESTVIPYALKLLIDGITVHADNREAIFQYIQPALWLAGLSWLIFIIIIRLQNWLQVYVIPKFQANIRMEVLDYLTQHDYRYFANHFAGNLANKVNDLPRALENIRLIICWNVIGTFATIFVALFVLTTINPLFAVIIGAWVVVNILLNFYRARDVNIKATKHADDRSILNGIIVDTLTNMIPTKLFASRHEELAYIGKSQAIEAKSNKRVIASMCWYRLSMDIPISIMLVLMVYYLIVYWQQGLITTGDFVFIFNISFAIMNHMWHFGHALADLFRDVGVANQAIRIINQPHGLTDKENAGELEVSEGKIAFDHVTFHYNKGMNIFENKSVVIKPKQKVGLVGFSGSGKTSFVHLILRFFDVESGNITIDEQNIADVTRDSLRAQISMIPQDTTLFHRTLWENIRYGRPSASDEEVIAAAKAANSHEFIKSLPKGYDELVGERGIKLSGGQRQRIAIARAMLKNAPILILDEATSALDSVTEKLIQESLHELMRNRTTIVIAHRLSTLSAMDRILVFDKGKIIEDGSHEALLQKKGHYAHMWAMQAGGFLPDTES